MIFRYEFVRQQRRQLGIHLAIRTILPHVVPEMHRRLRVPSAFLAYTFILRTIQHRLTEIYKCVFEILVVRHLLQLFRRQMVSQEWYLWAIHDDIDVVIGLILDVGLVGDIDGLVLYVLDVDGGSDGLGGGDGGGRRFLLDRQSRGTSLHVPTFPSLGIEFLFTKDTL